jgi:hypothetical protein
LPDGSSIIQEEIIAGNKLSGTKTKSAEQNPDKKWITSWRAFVPALEIDFSFIGIS